MHALQRRDMLLIRLQICPKINILSDLNQGVGELLDCPGWVWNPPNALIHDALEVLGGLHVMIFIRELTSLVWKSIASILHNRLICIWTNIGKRFRNANNIILRENDSIFTDPSSVSELFNDYFSSVAMDTGFDDCITSVIDAVAKHISHPSVVKIRDKYHTGNSYSFKLLNRPLHCFGARLIHAKLRDMTTTAISAKAFPSKMKCAGISPGFKERW